MEGVGSPPAQNTGSFLPHLLISICGITATALAILAYHLIVKYITRRWRQRQRSTLSATQTLQFSKGIEEKVLLTIPILAYSSKDYNLFRVDQSDCVICLGDLEDGEMVRLLPNCRHAFHVLCIGNWFLGHSTCPVCRSPVVVVEPKSTSGKSDLPTTVVDDDVRNEARLQRSASSSGVECLNMPIEEKKHLLAATLKRSLSMGECSNYVIVIVQNDDDDEVDDDDDEMCKQEGDDHQSGSSSSTRILRESKSFTARSMKQLDCMSSRVVRSFSQLRISSRSSGHKTADGILPY